VSFFLEGKSLKTAHSWLKLHALRSVAMNAVERIKQIFSQALEKAAGPERDAFLAEVAKTIRNCEAKCNPCYSPINKPERFSKKP